VKAVDVMAVAQTSDYRGMHPGGHGYCRCERATSADLPEQKGAGTRLFCCTFCALRFAPSVLEQFADDLSAVGKLDRSANRRFVLVCEVEADAIVNRGDQIFHLIWVLGHFGSLGVRST
jgi:hypothetical protein